jgi:hypothetical protein
MVSVIKRRFGFIDLTDEKNLKLSTFALVQIVLNENQLIRNSGISSLFEQFSLYCGYQVLPLFNAAAWSGIVASPLVGSPLSDD